MKKFKNQLALSGSLNHLLAFAKDLEEIGYKKYDAPDVTVSHITTYRDGKYALRNHTGGYQKFKLPEQWKQALELAGEKEEVKEEFTIECYVIAIIDCSSNKGKHHLVNGQVKRLHKRANLQCDVIYFNDTPPNEGTYNKEWFRKATPSEIEKHLISEAQKRGLVSGATVNQFPAYGYGIKNVLLKSNEYSYSVHTDNLWCGDHGIYTKGKWAELLPSYPLIEKLGYTAKFEEWGISFNDCAKFGKDTFISLHEMFLSSKIDPYTNRDIEFIKIGKAEFTPKEIKLIAEHFNKK